MYTWSLYKPKDTNTEVASRADAVPISDVKYPCKDVTYDTNGYVEVYYDDQDYCFDSSIGVSGIALLPKTAMGVVMFIFLCYLFFGIAIIADIFMEAIEAITSVTTL